MTTSPMMAVMYQAIARRHVAALEARAANIQCSAAFGGGPATPSGDDQARRLHEEQDKAVGALVAARKCDDARAEALADGRLDLAVQAQQLCPPTDQSGPPK